MTPRRRNIVVGLVVLVSMLGLAWMVLVFSSSSAASIFSRGTEFKIVADRATGLAVGSPVYYLGMQVGKVSGLRRLPNNSQVEITATLNEGETLPANVEAQIRQTSYLGQASAVYLDVKGDPSPQALGAGGKPLTGRHVGAAIVPEEFTGLARDLRQQQLVQHVDEAVIELRGQLRKVGGLVDSANALVGDPALREDLKATVANVRRGSEHFEKVSREFEKLTGETNKTLTGLNERLHQIAVVLDRFQSIADKIDKGQGTAGMLVNDPRLYESLVDTARTMNLTVSDLQRLVQQWEEEGISLNMK